MLQFTNNNKRYHTFDYEMKKRFGEKVGKIALDAGFTCPNRDGKIGVGGCLFCSESGSGDFAENRNLDIKIQIENGKKKVKEKWQNINKFIAYFQPFSNTYNSVSVLRKLYFDTCQTEGIVGVFIATRCDCINEEIATLLSELSGKTFLVVELGLQTSCDATLEAMNVGYNTAQFLSCFELLKSKNINVCIHTIIGLPNENYQDFIKTANFVAKLNPFAIKIHMLHILKNTGLNTLYERTNFAILSKDEYVEIVCDIIEILPPSVVIERLTGDGAHDILVAPMWTKRKRECLNSIDKTLNFRNSWQGVKNIL
ncbi:MAG: TIGR01212 family radical SAM protein [Clostridia bacterium]